MLTRIIFSSGNFDMSGYCEAEFVLHVHRKLYTSCRLGETLP